jgi:hypothetical protein
MVISALAYTRDPVSLSRCCTTRYQRVCAYTLYGGMGVCVARYSEGRLNGVRRPLQGGLHFVRIQFEADHSTGLQVIDLMH